jgi:predicted DsbA family dithiol-disulfide isomerase
MSLPDSVRPIAIEIVSDIVCPWCFIGKRRLEAALALYAQARPEAPPPRLSWLPFQLNPHLPPEGMDRLAYIESKFGPGQGHGRYARVAAVGAGTGIAFAFERIERQPNTRAAHALVALAGERGLQPQVKEALMAAYFLHGRDLTDAAELVRIAASAGLDPDAARDRLADANALAAVDAAEERSRALGVQGVPFFIFDRRHAVSGAQDPRVLLDAMLAVGSDAPAPA